MYEQFCPVRDVKDKVGETVKLAGWVRTSRIQKKLAFIVLRDGVAEIQCVVFQPDVSPETWEAAEKLTLESSLIVTGDVSKHPKMEGVYEIQVKEIEIVNLAENYPISKKEHGTEFLMDHRHLWVRSSKQAAILRIRDEMIKASRDFFYDNGFFCFDSPIFTPNACEGTTTLFDVDYFGEKVYLSQSGQLYQESGIMALGKTFCLGPTFRAEKSKTRRHLIEFWMLEAEAAFYDFEDNIKLQEDYVCYVVNRVLERRRTDLETIERDTVALERVTHPFPRIRYAEAVEILQGKGFDFNLGDDFGSPEETALAEDFDKPFFITHWPADMKAFYMKNAPNDPSLLLASDLMAPEGFGELIGGSQREDDADVLLEKIKKHKLPKEYFEWYLDLRRYGSVPHSGFGLGIERTVCWICGLHHIRESIPFPRMLYRKTP
ncbi:asparagine--tRNA ligase [bacterium]|nr:asparagine--tRNA ligase [bacterium]